MQIRKISKKGNPAQIHLWTTPNAYQPQNVS